MAKLIQQLELQSLDKSLLSIYHIQGSSQYVVTGYGNECTFLKLEDAERFAHQLAIDHDNMRPKHFKGQLFMNIWSGLTG